MVMIVHKSFVEFSFGEHKHLFTIIISSGKFGVDLPRGCETLPKDDILGRLPSKEASLSIKDTAASEDVLQAYQASNKENHKMIFLKILYEK